MTLTCPRCQGPIPNDVDRATGNTAFCPHCDALLIEGDQEWAEFEPTLPEDPPPDP